MQHSLDRHYYPLTHTLAARLVINPSSDFTFVYLFSFISGSVGRAAFFLEFAAFYFSDGSKPQSHKTTGR